MRKFVTEITEKPRWHEKVFDEAIVGKWRQEFKEQDDALVKTLWESKRDEYDVGEYDVDEHERDDEQVSRGVKLWPRDRVTDIQLDWVFAFLRWAAGEHDIETGIEATGIDKIHHSKELIPAELKAQLINAVSVLENVPPGEMDWHPGSNEQVLDLVHPSLFCFYIGKSLTKDPKTGREYTLTTEEYLEQRIDLPDISNPTFTSHQHQWLPTDFRVSQDGSVSPLGYINNMHPTRHAALYKAVVPVIQRFIPLWERVLNDVLSPDPPLAIPVDVFSWYDGIEELEPDYATYRDANKVQEYNKAYDEWHNKYHWPKIPEPTPFTPPSLEGRKTISLKGRTLQVIVKLANIVLTPDKPAYPGGSWHVEGMCNERIAATGIYYYASENISESRLAFRAAVGDGTGDSDEIRYDQSDFRGFRVAFGIEGSGGPLNQLLGSVVTKEDLCLAFPNIYQHRVAPFQLADPTKPGVRKILCFFLVDPTQRILSTTDVPPQQRDWCDEEIAGNTRMQTIPVELYDIIRSDAVEGTITLDEAREERAELMSERANFVMTHNEEIFEMEFNMCEH
ncbi:hypothetical protein CERSUDRAFT_115932 [Gelatoporia subvermispora B]|uniref:Uncharacterized protein n=1 Tax=Ceriporiopsis subvermispora (strain B) TaxID=914234 RepID=M2RB37_CERS8|nr:hypothetical protein CERSUDRAFT_115932 [Gelatoporia subvermispora B]